jgi:hypothetical protein
MERAGHVGAVRAVDVAGRAAGWGAGGSRRGGGVQGAGGGYIIHGARLLLHSGHTVGNEALGPVNVAAGATGCRGASLRGRVQAQREGGRTGDRASAKAAGKHLPAQIIKMKIQRKALEGTCRALSDM